MIDLIKLFYSMILWKNKKKVIYTLKIQSTLVISNSKGPSEILRDIRT